MIEELGLAETPNSPKPLFKHAHENELFDMPLEHWLVYADRRVGKTHDDSGEKAQACLDVMENFIDDAMGLYQTLSGETWE